MRNPPLFNLGAWRRLDGERGGNVLRLPAHHLVTHGAIVGMTGSGKTGLLTVFIEEALRSGIPTLVVDVKGDLPNLSLSFPSFAPEAFLPWEPTARRSRPGTSERLRSRATRRARMCGCSHPGRRPASCSMCCR